MAAPHESGDGETDAITVPESLTDTQKAQQRSFDEFGLETRSTFIETGSPPVLTHVIETGSLDSADPPLVFIHGGGSNGAIFTPLLAELADRRLIVVDRPGFGVSGDVEVTARTVRQRAVENIEGVLDGFDLTDATLVCSSMGGFFGLVFALTYPERVRQLVLLGSIPTFPGTTPPLPLRVMTIPIVGDFLWGMGEPSPEQTIKQYEIFGEGETIQQYPALIDALVAQSRTDRADAMDLMEFRSLLGLRGWKSASRLRTDELRSLEPPAVFIWGDADLLGTPEDVEDYIHAIPGARLHTIDAGHAPWLGHPETCAELIRDALTEKGDVSKRT